MTDQTGKALPFAQEPDPYSIILPCSQDDFGQFISGLLGKAQTIERYFVGTFEITRNDVDNTFHLIDQRIRQQNEATLVQFTVKLFYDDGSSVLLNSLPDFLSYVEVRPIISTTVHLSWIYLIKFPDKKFPERQQIDLTFAPEPTESKLNMKRVIVFDPFDNVIRFRISHTARTWGVDIESLLTGHIESLLKSESKLKRFIYNHSDAIGVSMAALTFLFALFGAYLSMRRFRHTQIGNAQSLISSQSGLNEKIDFLIQSNATGEWQSFGYALLLFLFISAVISVLLGIWVGSTADNKPKSFILISKKAEEAKAIYEQKRKNGWRLFVISIVTSIITKLIANVIFSWLTHS